MNPAISSKKCLTNGTIKIGNAFYYPKKVYFSKIFLAFEIELVIAFCFKKSVTETFFTNICHISDSSLKSLRFDGEWHRESGIPGSVRCTLPASFIHAPFH